MNNNADEKLKNNEKVDTLLGDLGNFHINNMVALEDMKFYNDYPKNSTQNYLNPCGSSEVNEMDSSEIGRQHEDIEDIKKPLEKYSSLFLDSIRNGKKESRILLDMLAVSVSPVIAKHGWMPGEHDTEEDRYMKYSVDRHKERVKHMKLKTTDDNIRDSRDWNQYQNMQALPPDEFIEWFFEKNDFFNPQRDDKNNLVYEDIGAGDGYTTGRRYAIGWKKGSTDVNLAYIVFRFFDPFKNDLATDAYKADSVYLYNIADDGTKSVKFYDDELNEARNDAMANYLRQKMYIKCTGNVLQVLREQGTQMKFICNLYRLFKDVVCTQLDLTCDFFNYEFTTTYFNELNKEDKFLSRSTLNVSGDSLNPTLYIGKYKGARTIMIYDKKAESDAVRKVNNEADEPELFEAVNGKVSNSYIRVEQHFNRERKEAAQILDNLVSVLWWDVTDDAFDYYAGTVKLKEEYYKEYGKVHLPLTMQEASSIFLKRISETLRQFVDGKCRFLKEPRRKQHNERIETDDQWQIILDTISTTKSDITFDRGQLTLEDQKKNFIEKGIGGNNFLKRVIELEGVEAVKEMWDAQLDYVLESMEQDARREEREKDKKMDRKISNYKKLHPEEVKGLTYWEIRKLIPD